MQLRQGIVVATHPEDYSVDLVMLDDGSRVVGAQVMTMNGSARAGSVDLPSVGKKKDKWDLSERTDNEATAIVGMMRGNPVVMGFMYPQVSQMTFDDPDRRMNRHVSGVYHTVKGDGSSEFYHPSGAYVRISETTEHENLDGKNFDKNFSASGNKNKNVNIHLQASGGKSSATIQSDGSVIVRASDKITFNTPLLEVPDGDVVAKGVSLVKHVHRGVQAGSGFSGLPMPGDGGAGGDGGGGEPDPGDPTPGQPNLGVTVESSHPDIILFSGLEDFQRMPFLEVNPPGYYLQRHTRPTMTEDGVTIRDSSGQSRRQPPGVLMEGPPKNVWILKSLKIFLPAKYRPTWVDEIEEGGSLTYSYVTSEPDLTENNIGVPNASGSVIISGASVLRGTSKWNASSPYSSNGSVLVPDKTYIDIPFITDATGFINGATPPPVDVNYVSLHFEFKELWYVTSVAGLLGLESGANVITNEKILSDGWIKITIPLAV